MTANPPPFARREYASGGSSPHGPTAAAAATPFFPTQSSQYGVVGTTATPASTMAATLMVGEEVGGIAQPATAAAGMVQHEIPTTTSQRPLFRPTLHATSASRPPHVHSHPYHLPQHQHPRYALSSQQQQQLHYRQQQQQQQPALPHGSRPVYLLPAQQQQQHQHHQQRHAPLGYPRQQQQQQGQQYPLFAVPPSQPQLPPQPQQQQRTLYPTAAGPPQQHQHQQQQQQHYYYHASAPRSQSLVVAPPPPSASQQHRALLPARARVVLPPVPDWCAAAMSTLPPSPPAPPSAHAESTLAAPPPPHLARAGPQQQQPQQQRLSAVTSVVRGSHQYTLNVRQHADRARLCGHSDKRTDRRPIDPCPIVQLSAADLTAFPSAAGTALPVSPLSYADSGASGNAQLVAFPNISRLVAMAELTPCPEDGSAPPRSRRELAAITVGATASSAHRLEDLDGNDAVFFAFPDISVRVEGVFRLKVTLYEWVGTKMVRIAAVQTNSFTIYRPKKFPGLEESTALSRHLSEQGVKIRLRQPRAARKNTGTAAARDSAFVSTTAVASPGAAAAATEAQRLQPLTTTFPLQFPPSSAGPTPLHPLELPISTHAFPAGSTSRPEATGGPTFFESWLPAPLTARALGGPQPFDILAASSAPTPTSSSGPATAWLDMSRPSSAGPRSPPDRELTAALSAMLALPNAGATAIPASHALYATSSAAPPYATESPTVALQGMSLATGPSAPPPTTDAADPLSAAWVAMMLPQPPSHQQQQQYHGLLPSQLAPTPPTMEYYLPPPVSLALPSHRPQQQQQQQYQHLQSHPFPAATTASDLLFQPHHFPRSYDKLPERVPVSSAAQATILGVGAGYPGAPPKHVKMEPGHYSSTYATTASSSPSLTSFPSPAVSLREDPFAGTVAAVTSSSASPSAVALMGSMVSAMRPMPVDPVPMHFLTGPPAASERSGSGGI